MPRLSRLARCVAFGLLAVPLATSAFAASPTTRSTTPTAMPAHKASGPYAAPAMRSPLTAGPALPFSQPSPGRLPFGAMAGPNKVQVPGVTVTPKRVQVPGVPPGPTKAMPPTTTEHRDHESLDLLIAGARVKF